MKKLVWVIILCALAWLVGRMNYKVESHQTHNPFERRI